LQGVKTTAAIAATGANRFILVYRHDRSNDIAGFAGCSPTPFILPL
jgi:hypothetical protein